MENLHKSHDSARFRDAQNEFRLSEAKNKLVREAQDKLLSQLRKNKVEGVKIIDTQISSLEIKEDLDSGLPLYTGTAIITATFLQGKSSKSAQFVVNVTDSGLAIIDQEFQKSLDTSSDLNSEAPVALNSSVVKASLKEFKLVDDGSKYLKVYHEAAYGDIEPIGAVAKAEYVECSDKVGLFKTMFQDEALSWPATVEFTDTFVEPVVKEAAPIDMPPFVVKEDPSLRTPSAPEIDLSSKFKSTNTLRMAVEASENVYNDLKNRMTQRAITALIDSLKARKNYFKVRTTETSYDPESKSGAVVVHTELLDNKDYKVVPLEVKIADDTMSLPTQEQITSLLQNTKIIESAEPAQLTAEQIQAKLNKKADVYMSAPQQYQMQDFLRMPKEFLPASLKEGDCIYTDGARYKLVSKSEGQLSKEKDSSPYWLFEKVRETGSDNIPVFRVDY